MFAEIRLRPWWMAPLLLLRRPGVTVALAAAACIATLPVASAPLFLSSAQSASIARQVETFPPAFSGVRVVAPLTFTPAEEVFTNQDGFVVSGPTIAAARAAHAESAASDIPNLDQMRVTLVAGASLTGRDLGGGVLIANAEAESTPAHDVVLLAREGFTDEIEVLAGGSGDGVSVPDSIADDLQVAPGATVTLSARGERFELPVSTVHRDLRRVTLSPYWASVGSVLQSADLTQRQPATVLVEPETFLEIAQALHLFTDHMVEFPLIDANPSRQLAGETIHALPSMREDLFAREAEGYYFRGQGVEFLSDLPRFVGRSDLVEGALRAPVGAASVAGCGVGLLVVGAAALLWTRRRRRELVVLATHGVGPGALGLKASMEAAPAIVLGSTVGWISARWLMATAAPSPTVAADAVAMSIVAAVIAATLALVVVGVTAGVRCRALTDTQPTRSGLLLATTKAPWELALLAGAVLVWFWMDADTVVKAAGEYQIGSVVRLPPAVFVTPILAGVGVVILLARLGNWWLRRRARAIPPGGNSTWLAWRRIGRDRAASLVLAAATALPVALAGYGAVVAQSAEATLVARAKAFVGADVVIDLSASEPVPPSLAELGDVTEVISLDGVQLGSVTTRVLFVDKKTFAHVVDVGDILVGGSLAELLDQVDSRSPARILATPTAPTGASELSFRDTGTVQVLVETVPELPARRSGYPVAVVSRELLPELLPGALPPAARTQLWARGEDPEAIRAVAERDLSSVERVRLADEQYQGTLLEPVTYTYTYLVAVSVLTASVVVVGLLLHLESRSVAYRRAYLLLQRMGIRPRTHRAALLWELGGLLCAGVAIGVGIVALLVALLSPAFDPRPAVLPGTVVSVPATPFVVIAVALVVTAVGATLFAHARAVRAKAGEMLREAGGTA